MNVITATAATAVLIWIIEYHQPCRSFHLKQTSLSSTNSNGRKCEEFAKTLSFQLLNDINNANMQIDRVHRVAVQCNKYLTVFEALNTRNQTNAHAFRLNCHKVHFNLYRCASFFQSRKLVERQPSSGWNVQLFSFSTKQVTPIRRIESLLLQPPPPPPISTG